MNIFEDKNQYGKFYLLEKDLISTHIYNHKEWEPHLIYFYSNFIQSDFIIIDAGANIGFHSVQFAKLAKTGLVYSFEPQPLIFNILNLNILNNNLSSKIIALQLGISDHINQYRMSSIHEQVFSENIINYGGRRILSGDAGEITHTISLDNFFNNPKAKIDLIKLDIQGHELEAIRGAEQLISNNYPIFLLENYTTQPYLAKDKQVLEELKKHGYSIYRIQAVNNEDCIALRPDIHQKQTEFIHNQTKYKFIK